MNEDEHVVKFGSQGLSIYNDGRYAHIISINAMSDDNEWSFPAIREEFDVLFLYVSTTTPSPSRKKPKSDTGRKSETSQNSKPALSSIDNQVSSQYIEKLSPPTQYLQENPPGSVTNRQFLSRAIIHHPMRSSNHASVSKSRCIKNTKFM